MRITLFDPRELNQIEVKGFSIYVEKAGESAVLYIRNHPEHTTISKGDTGIKLFLGCNGDIEVMGTFKYDCPDEN